MNNSAASYIASVGYYLPEMHVRTEDMLREIDPDRFGVDITHIEMNVGVSEVRHSDPGQKPSALAIAAAEKALAQSAINYDQIDLIVFCGIEGDYAEPSTAHIIQAALGLNSGICFDVQNACLGFMTGLQIADAMIASGAVRYALVCTGEKPSMVSKATIRELKKSSDVHLFKNKLGMLTVGDAGGAMIIGPRDQNGFLNFGTDSQGQYAKLCYYKQKNDGYIEGQMVMGRICAVTINAHKSIYRDTLAVLGWSPENIDCLITHQVGAKPFSLLSQLFDVPESKMTRTYHSLGNITSATFPVNYGLALEEGRIKQNSRVWAAMSGSGISVCHSGFTA